MFDTLSEKEKIIFLAGVFDGEGSFGSWSTGKGRKRVIALGVETTDEDMVKRFHDVFGGLFYKRAKRIQGKKETWQWKMRGEPALKTLKAMIPYMCKRRKEKFYGLVEPFGYGSEDWGSYIQKQTRVKEVNE